jgi:hypothetical protein
MWMIVFSSPARPSAGCASGGPPYGHQRPCGPDQACGPLLDVPTDDIGYQVDAADVFEGVVVEVDELLRAEVEPPFGGRRRVRCR